jgi:hypothetical protein
MIRRLFRVEKKNRILSQGDQKIWTNSSNFYQSSLQAPKYQITNTKA